MATPQLSPGVLTREVDLTVGRADNVLDNIGAIAGPFAIGPVDYPVDVTTEQELINYFGKPLNDDGQYEYWLSASSYLSYGGVLKVVRTGSDEYLRTANAKRERTTNLVGVSTASYIGIASVGVGTTARTAGTYSGITTYTTSGTGSGATFDITVAANGSIGTIAIVNDGDNFEEGDTITVSNTQLGAVGFGTTGSISFSVTNVTPTITNISVVGNANLQIKNPDDYEFNHADSSAAYMFAAKNPGTWANGLKVALIDDKADQTITLNSSLVSQTKVGYAFTSRRDSTESAGVGVTTTFTGYLKAIVTGVNSEANTVDVKICSLVPDEGNEIPVTYAQRSTIRSFRPGDVVGVSSATAGIDTTTIGPAADNVLDWYDQQIIQLSNTSIYWNSIAPKPITSQYVAERGGANDAMNIAIFDDTGKITGIQGNLLEKHIGISKALDTVSRVNSPQRTWYKNFLAQASNYVYAGYDPSDNEVNNEPVYPTGFDSGFSPYTNTDGQWNQPAQGVTFGAIGNITYSLLGGTNYDANDGYSCSLGDIFTSYSLFSNKDEQRVDYLIMGPGFTSKSESQAKANHLIAIAEQRRDCIAVISPNRDAVVDVPDSNTQTDKVIEFFSSISPNGDQGAVRSSSYAVFDSGYKYTYDRFNNRFRYIPCNPDVAGLMVRTSILAYPWYSPAGQQRGVLNNAIKLAYNPSKGQRDRLYPERINPIINQSGVGILLYGDKTALGYASAFDRINVRRLFLTVEQALERTAQAQLFELNDEITRSNFINIVQPYLRDIQAKRGLYDFMIICDSSNNTPDVIDNNEFRADIFLKPTKSINYVTLTFVATRTGISFEEVAGRT